MAVESKLMQAARRILRPLVRIMLRNGIPAKALTEMVRQTFVDVADEEFVIEGKRQTIARIAVITGLNRKEVARLRANEPLEEDDEGWWNRAAHVLGSWLRDDAFLDRKGDPLDLPLVGDSPTFTDLVRKHSGDMYPRSIADELLRLGAIEEVDGKLRMTHRGYVPGSDPERLVEIFGIDTSELMETIDHNLQAATDEERLFQLKVLSDNVPVEHLDEFNAYSSRLARPVLEELAHWLSERDKGRDWSGEDQRVQVGLGIFQINREARRPASPAGNETVEHDDGN